MGDLHSENQHAELEFIEESLRVQQGFEAVVRLVEEDRA